jgi:hypothetical protein
MAANGTTDPHNSSPAAGKPGATRGPGYETRDANIADLLKFGASLAAVLILVSFGMKWMFGYLAKTQSLGPPTTPFENTRTIPPLPRLQVAPQREIHDYWESEQEILNSYGWIDRKAGVVRIPIDRAMRLVLQRGLPTRPANEAKAIGEAGTAGGGAQTAGGAGEPRATKRATSDGQRGESQ